MDFNKVLYDKCKQEVKCKLLGIENVKLKHSDLVKLSEEIYTSSNISLSLSTLKRIFRDAYSVTPQMTTLDALVIYLGYANWIAYVQENSITLVRNTTHKNGRFIPFRKGLLIISIILLTGLMAWFVRFKFFSDKKDPYGSVKFSYTLIDNDGWPPSVKYSYDISQVDFEKAQIWPYGNGSDGFDIDRYDSISLSGYGWYGTFYPKLVIDDSIVRILTIDVQSHVWKAAVSNVTDKGFVVEYFYEPEVFTQGKLAISDKLLEQHDFNYNEIENYIYCIARNFPDINGDSLNFETRIKTKQLHKGDIAGIHTIRLVFQKGLILLPVTEKHFNISIPLGLFDVWKIAKTFDLSVFKIKPDSWNTINILTSNKTAEISINEKLILSQEFKAEPGHLKQIEFLCYGKSEVDYVRFFNPEHELIYADEFE